MPRYPRTPEWRQLATASEMFDTPVRRLRTLYYSGEISHVVIARRVYVDVNELRRLFDGQATRRGA